jgi:2-phospho-L-lactate guanylyltransferase
MRQRRHIWAVVPVKSFGRAKARLAPLLDPAQREELARAMLQDVLAALQNVDELSGILVVSGDSHAREIAGAHGAGTIDEPFENGPNAAIRLALPVLRATRADAMIIVPADVPQIEPNELRPVLRALSGASVALVPAARDGGTNLLGCSPVDIIDPCFGPNSFAKHMNAAERIGVEPRVFTCDSLAVDIDRPRDILEFRAWRETRAGAYLARVLNSFDMLGVAACAQ